MIQVYYFLMMTLRHSYDMDEQLYSWKVESIQANSVVFSLIYMAIVVLVDYLPMLTFQVSLLVSYKNNVRASKSQDLFQVLVSPSS